MPFVHIYLTGDEEAPTAQQKQQLIAESTEMLSRILGKNPATTFVIIDEVPMDNWGIAGSSVRERRQKAKKTSDQ